MVDNDPHGDMNHLAVSPIAAGGHAGDQQGSPTHHTLTTCPAFSAKDKGMLKTETVALFRQMCHY